MNNMKIWLPFILLIIVFSTGLSANEAKPSSNPYLQNYESNYFASQTEVANQVSRQIAILEAMEATATNSITNKKDSTNIGYAGTNNTTNTPNIVNTNTPSTGNMQQPNQTVASDNNNPWSKPNPWPNPPISGQNNQNVSLPPPPNIFTGPTAKAPAINNQTTNNTNAATTVAPNTKPDLTN